MSDTLSTLKNYEPIRDNRFIVRFPSELNIQSWWVKSVTMPFVTFKNEGDEQWNDITIKFRSFMGPSTTQGLQEIKKVKDFEINIEMLDITGVSIQKWGIEVEKILSIDFGGLATYDADSIQEITTILKVKNCILYY